MGEEEDGGGRRRNVNCRSSRFLLFPQPPPPPSYSIIIPSPFFLKVLRRPLLPPLSYALLLFSAAKKTFSPSILSLRKVRKSEGLDLASSFSALFFEVSAAAGRNVEEALAELAKRLRDREDRDLRNAAALRQVKI